MGNPQTKDILVTGATGFIGRQVTARLQAAGYRARILARQPGHPGVRALASRYSAAVVSGNVLDPYSLRAAAQGAHGVIHLVGIISEAGRITFENLHVRATANVLQAAQAAGARRYVHMSALGTRPGAPSRYHQTKWAAEDAVRGSGLDWTIFRPSLVYGAEDHFVNLFAQMSRFSPALPLMGSGRAKFQPVAVETVAEAFVKALAEPRAVGQTFDLCGPDTLTFREMLRAILGALGRKRLLLSLPLPVAKLQAAALELIFGKILRRPPPLNRDQLTMLQEDNVGNAAPAVDLFHLRRQSFAAGIRAYLRR